MADPSVVDALNTLRAWVEPTWWCTDAACPSCNRARGGMDALAVVETALADQRVKIAEREAALDGITHNGAEWLTERLDGLRHAYDRAEARVVAAEAERDTLRRLVVEHHALGAMNNLEWGGQCPVCAKNPRARAALVPFAAHKDTNHASPTCPKCGRDLHGYRGPLCRYCTPGEYTE